MSPAYLPGLLAFDRLAAGGSRFALLAALTFGVTGQPADRGRRRRRRRTVVDGRAGYTSVARRFAAAAERKPRGPGGGRARVRPVAGGDCAHRPGMLAPAVYVIGLRDAGPFFASLTLNMEAPFSVAIAALVFHEYVNGRVLVAMLGDRCRRIASERPRQRVGAGCISACCWWSRHRAVGARRRALVASARSRSAHHRVWKSAEARRFRL